MPDPSNIFSFTKDGKFLDKQIDASITVTASPAAASRIAANAPFPAGTTKVGNLSASISGQTGDLKFEGGRAGGFSLPIAVNMDPARSLCGSAARSVEAPPLPLSGSRH
jgi:hypothetical protein